MGGVGKAGWGGGRVGSRVVEGKRETFPTWSLERRRSPSHLFSYICTFAPGGWWEHVGGRLTRQGTGYC